MRRVELVCAVGAIAPIGLALQWMGSSDPDFATLWSAGRAAIAGSAVYGGWFPYPPHSLFLFAPFGLLPLWPAYFAFNLLGLALFYWSARPYLPDDFPPYLPLCTPAALFCLYYGQTGLIVGALWLMAFRGTWPAVALLTFKPHLGILSALSLNRRTVTLTTVLVVILFAAGALVFGQWREFLDAASRQAGAIGANSKWAYVGVGPAIGYGFWGWIFFGLAALVLLLRNVTPFTAATAALLISPYGFHYDMVAASLGFALALRRETSVAKTIAFALALLLPVLVRFGAWLAPPILLWALWSFEGRRELGFRERLRRPADPQSV